MGIYVRKKIPYTGSASGEGTGADDISVRYNEESDYFEVKKNGEWEQSPIKVGLAKQYLFSSNNNAVNFSAYAGTIYSGHATKAPTVTVGQKLTVVFNATTSNLVAGCAISDLVDVTNYSKIVLSYESTSTGTSNWEWAKLFVTNNKTTTMTALATTTILSAQDSSSGIVELDVSSVSGEVYVGIEMSSNCKIVTVNVDEMYLE